ncbi:MFS transporter, partial [Salmonella enterica subsp. enterica serovar Kentucky]
LLCVFITPPVFIKTIRSPTFFFFYTFIFFIALLPFCLHPPAFVFLIFEWVFVFSSAGGLVQIGLPVMAARFPPYKGNATGIYY